jgi:hypothetical protein
MDDNEIRSAIDQLVAEERERDASVVERYRQ